MRPNFCNISLEAKDYILAEAAAEAAPEAAESTAAAAESAAVVASEAADSAPEAASVATDSAEEAASPPLQADRDRAAPATATARTILRIMVFLEQRVDHARNLPYLMLPFDIVHRTESLPQQ
jgi:hypothetical protein